MPYKPPPLGWESGPEEIIAPVGNNHFSVIEQNWIVENFMTEFLEVDGKRKVKQGKGAAESKATEADVFRQKIIAAFVETFPYRLPENAENQEFIPKLLELTWTDEEYGRAPQKLYSWLQKRKPDWAKGKTSTAAGGRSVSAPKIFYLSDHYRPDEEETKLEEETLRTLLRLLNGSWSSLDAEELKELREEIPTHMANILRTMSRIMGVEIVAYGAWEADKKLNVFDVSSPRAKTFLADELSAWTRDELLNHLVASLGPNFSVDPEDVESTVHGNADRDFHPLLPTCPLPQLRLARQLDLWYNAKWRHQGGKHHVPYDLLQEDSENGVYALTSRERYPPELSVFKDPWTMSDKEREMWRDHITQGQLDNLPESKRFMFLQPSPGQFDLVWKTTPGRDARVSYLPEGQNYARSLLKISERRVDRLPIAHSGQHYETFQASVEQRLMQYFPNPNNIYVKLLKVGGFYDRAAPAQETEESFQARRQIIQLLQNRMPGLSEGPTYLTLTAEIFFPEAFYKTRSKTKGPPGFAPLIDWCQPNAWLHQPSQTLLGGPFGVKWPVLLVVTLAINCMLIHRAEGPHPPFVDSVKPSFTADQLTTVEKLAWEWVKALGKSYDLLGLSLRDRLAPESAPGLAWLEEWTAEKDLKDVEATGLLPWASEWEEREMAPVGPETGGYRHPKSSRRRESGSSPPKNEPKKRRRAKKKTEVGQDDEGEAQMSSEESQEGSWSAADSEGDGTEETPSDAVRGAGAEEKDELESEDEKDAQPLVEPDPFRRQTRSKSAASGRSAV